MHIRSWKFEAFVLAALVAWGCGAQAPTIISIAPETGPISGGTTVTITGTGFMDVESVTIGGQSLTELSVAGGTSITGKTTAGAGGAQDVVVTTAAGSSTRAAGFTYHTATWQLGTAGDDFIGGEARDSAGNILVAGYTTGSFPGFTNAGGNDLFVAKLSSSGVLLWTRQLGTDGDEVAVGVTTDASGNVYVSGDTTGSFPGFTNAGVADWFVIKLDGGGATQWIHQLGTPGYDYASEIGLDGAGNVYMTGRTSDSFPGAFSAGLEDIAVAKLNSSGVEQWVSQIGTADRDQARALAVDAGGNVYIAGQTRGSLPGFISAGLYDAFVIRLDADGSPLWYLQVGTAGADTAYGLDVGADGSVYMAGVTSDSLPGSTSAGGTDLFVARVDSGGTLRWMRQAGTPADDAAYELAVGSSAVYVTGDTSGAFSGLANAGGSDGFVLKLGLDGAQQWVRQLGTAGDEFPRGLNVDGSDNVYVSGGTSGSFPGFANRGAGDLFLLRYSAGGDLL